MRYISIDPAVKTIAVAVIDYHGSQDNSIYSSLQVIYTETADLAKGRKNEDISDLERCKLIHDFMTRIYDQWYLPESTTTLIEKQISGTPTYICFISIINVAISRNAGPTIAIPTHKNRLTIGNLKLSDFYKKTLNSYTANKEHSRAMFRYIRPKLQGADNIKFNTAHEKDLADCFTQLIAALGLVDVEQLPSSYHP